MDKPTDKNEDNKSKDNQNYADPRQPDEQKPEQERTSKTETIFTIFSVILIVLAASYLVVQSLGTPAPPAFTTELSYHLPRGNHAAVDVFIKNTGDEAAKAVHVSGEVAGTDGTPVEAEATLDWLPGNSTRKVTLLFPTDKVTTATPEIHITGYEEP
jgi:uncharacterized protein (TIGR02588 family)